MMHSCPTRTLVPFHIQRLISAVLQISPVADWVINSSLVQSAVSINSWLLQRYVTQIKSRIAVAMCCLSVGARIFRIGVVPPLSPGAFIRFPGRRRIWLTSRIYRTSTANKELPAGASEDAARYRGCKCQHFLCGWMFFSCASSAKREKFGSHETMLIRPTVATRRSLCQNRQKRAGYRVSDGNRETLTRCHWRSRFWESSREKLNNDWFWNKRDSIFICWYWDHTKRQLTAMYWCQG